MITTKLLRFVAAIILAGMICAGCSMGPKNSDEANHDWSPAKAGMTHDQFMAEFREKMGQHQIGTVKMNAPQEAIKAGVHAPQTAQVPPK